jgi:hypothetical protein
MHAHRLGHQGNNGRLRWPPLAFELGANNFIDLAKDRWVDAVGQADLVVDAIGGDIPSGRLRSCAPGGA